jgi:hypothetical protein
MNLVVSNEALMTSNVQAYNFEAHCFTMIDNALHNLTMLQIIFLIVVYL